MEPRRYYAVRTGLNPAVRLDLPMIKRLFLPVYSDLTAKGFFQEWLGVECVDVPEPIPGRAGTDLEAFFLRRLRKSDLVPIPAKIEGYTEDDLFDVIELLHDLVSEGREGSFHAYAECGWHYEKFDPVSGREVYRSEINALLGDYGSGYQLSDDGEVLHLGNRTLDGLLADVALMGANEVDTRVREAVHKFRRRSSGTRDQRDAVRDLADVLEYLRPQLKSVMDKRDEGDLFNLLNNFGVRHHNTEQRLDYDSDLWLEAVFYHLLNMVHLSVRLLGRKAQQN